MEKSILTPKEIAQSSISVAENKANMVWWRQFLLAIMAGLFIGLAGNGASITAYSVPAAGMSKMLSGVLFGTGLILVLMAGAELFTGNSLMLIGVAEKKIRISAMLRNWVIVYIGNFIGGVGLAWCISQTTQFGTKVHWVHMQLILHYQNAHWILRRHLLWLFSAISWCALQSG